MGLLSALFGNGGKNSSSGGKDRCYTCGSNDLYEATIEEKCYHPKLEMTHVRYYVKCRNCGETVREILHDNT